MALAALDISSISEPKAASVDEQTSPTSNIIKFTTALARSTEENINYTDAVIRSIKTRDFGKDQFPATLKDFFSQLSPQAAEYFSNNQSVYEFWRYIEEARTQKMFNDIHHIVSRSTITEISLINGEELSPNSIPNLILINRGVHEVLHLEKEHVAKIIFERLEGQRLTISDLNIYLDVCEKEYYGLYDFIDHIHMVLHYTALVRTVHFLYFQEHPKLKGKNTIPDYEIERIFGKHSLFLQHAELIFPSTIMPPETIQLLLQTYNISWADEFFSHFCSVYERILKLQTDRWKSRYYHQFAES